MRLQSHLWVTKTFAHSKTSYHERRKSSHRMYHLSLLPTSSGRLTPLSNRRIQRLSGDLVRATEALKAWGQGEGLDLGVSFGPETT